MAWTICIDPDVNCAFIKRYGTFDINDRLNAVKSMLSHPDFQSGMNTMHDARDVQIPPDVSFESLAESFKRINQEYVAKVDRGKAAIVAGDAQSFAKIHQYLVSGRLDKSPVERKAFRDIEKAMAWLGLPEGYEIKYPEPEETT